MVRVRLQADQGGQGAGESRTLAPPAVCAASKKELPQDNDQLPFWRIQELLSNASWTSHWDEASQTPYLVDTADEAGWREVWYDNPKSLRLKVGMAKELGVKAFGMWYIQQPQTLWGTIPKDFLWDTGRRTLSTTANREIFSAGLLGCVFQRLQR